MKMTSPGGAKENSLPQLFHRYAAEILFKF